MLRLQPLGSVPFRQCTPRQIPVRLPPHNFPSHPHRASHSWSPQALGATKPRRFATKGWYVAEWTVLWVDFELVKFQHISSRFESQFLIFVELSPGYPQDGLNEIHGAWYDPSNPVVQMSGNLRGDLFEWLREWEERADLVLVLGTSLSGMNADRMVLLISLKIDHRDLMYDVDRHLAF